MGLFYDKPSTTSRTVTITTDADLEDLVPVEELDKAFAHAAIDDAGERQLRIDTVMRSVTPPKGGKRYEVDETTDHPPPNRTKLFVGFALVALLLVLGYVIDGSGTHTKTRDVILNIAQTGFVGIFAVLGIEGAKK